MSEYLESGFEICLPSMLCESKALGTDVIFQPKLLSHNSNGRNKFTKDTKILLATLAISGTVVAIGCSGRVLMLTFSEDISDP